MGGQRIQDLVNKAEAAKDDSSVTSARVVLSDETAAQTAFNEYCRNLTDIRQWKESSTPSSYEAFDGRGEVVSNEPLAVGRFIRIAIAGSGKYDWVRVVSIDRYPDEMILSVSPTFDPTESRKRPMSSPTSSLPRRPIISACSGRVGTYRCGSSDLTNIKTPTTRTGW